jgi:hypothetical protein
MKKNSEKKLSNDVDIQDISDWKPVMSEEANALYKRYIKCNVLSDEKVSNTVEYTKILEGMRERLEHVEKIRKKSKYTETFIDSNLVKESAIHILIKHYEKVTGYNASWVLADMQMSPSPGRDYDFEADAKIYLALFIDVLAEKGVSMNETIELYAVFFKMGKSTTKRIKYDFKANEQIYRNWTVSYRPKKLQIWYIFIMIVLLTWEEKEYKKEDGKKAKKEIPNVGKKEPKIKQKVWKVLNEITADLQKLLINKIANKNFQKLFPGYREDIGEIITFFSQKTPITFSSLMELKKDIPKRRLIIREFYNFLDLLEKEKAIKSQILFEETQAA